MMMLMTGSWLICLLIFLSMFVPVSAKIFTSSASCYDFIVLQCPRMKMECSFRPCRTRALCWNAILQLFIKYRGWSVCLLGKTAATSLGGWNLEKTELVYERNQLRAKLVRCNMHLGPVREQDFRKVASKTKLLDANDFLASFLAGGYQFVSLPRLLSFIWRRLHKLRELSQSICPKIVR